MLPAFLRLTRPSVFTTSLSKLVPPHQRLRLSTSSLSQRTPKPSRLLKYSRRTVLTLCGVGAVWIVDRQYNASAITRNIRTFWTVRLIPSRLTILWSLWCSACFPSQCSVIALDYKLNFTPELSDTIPLLHERVAERMYDLFTSNGGLYIKIGADVAHLTFHRVCLCQHWCRAGIRKQRGTNAAADAGEIREAV